MKHKIWSNGRSRAIRGSMNSPFGNTNMVIMHALLLAAIDWGSLLLDLAWLLSVPVFNYVLYQSRLIPRWLSAWGLIGGILWLATWPVRMFGLGPPMIEIFALPIAAQEMVLAVWLIIKGFDSSAIAS